MAQFRQSEGEGWISAFVDFYLGERRQAALPDSCALQSLIGDVARADPEAKQVFNGKLEEVLRAMTAEGPRSLRGKPDRADATALLALLSGAVSITRAADNAALQEEIAAAVQRAAIRLIGVASPQ